MSEATFTTVGLEKTAVSENAGPYKNICGAEDGNNAGIIDKFSRQIGCLPTLVTNIRSQIARNTRYRSKFQKAKKCVSRRLTRMGTYNAATNANQLTRERHAHAARVAYALGKRCLQELDMPTNLYRRSTDELITKINTRKPGVRKAVTGANSGKTINNAIATSDALSSLFKPIEVSRGTLAAALTSSANMSAAAGAGAAPARAAALTSSANMSAAAAGAGAAPLVAPSGTVTRTNVPKARGSTKKANKGKKSPAASAAVGLAANNNFNLLEPAFPFDINKVKSIDFLSIISWVHQYQKTKPNEAISELKTDERLFSDFVAPILFCLGGSLIRFLKLSRAHTKTGYIAPSMKYSNADLTEINYIFDLEKRYYNIILDSVFKIINAYGSHFKTVNPQMAKYLGDKGTALVKQIEDDFIKENGRISWKKYFPQLARDDIDPEIEEFL